jgi:hypothetical protein
VYIVTFVVVFILFATGACIQIFRLYHVNYAFIFEVDQNYKMIHHQMYKVTLIFFFIWGFCWLCQIAKEKTEFAIFPAEATYSLIAIVLFILLCIHPFRFLFRQARWELAKSLGEIVISPFGLVRFRHFFLADVLTSTIIPIQMSMIIYCYFAGS